MPLEGNDVFLSQNSENLFHRAEWKNVFAVYGLKYQRLTVARNGQIVGSLPLVLQKSLLFGNQLVSLPWFDAAGMIASDQSARDELINQALDLANACGTKVLQIRQSDDLSLSLYVRTDKVVQRLRLFSNPDELWDSFKATVRNQIRKAEKNGLTVIRGGRELTKDFFNVYSKNMRDLGSPSHSLKLFEAVLETFPKEASLFVVRHENATIGGGLTLDNGKTLEIPWASSLREYNKHCVNHVMYWQILKYACEAGYDWFSFGRSTRDSGPHRYKKQWGPEEIPLHWYFLSRQEKDAASAAIPPKEKFGLASRLWCRLPLSLSQTMGPKLMARLA